MGPVKSLVATPAGRTQVCGGKGSGQPSLRTIGHAPVRVHPPGLCAEHSALHTGVRGVCADGEEVSLDLDLEERRRWPE